MELEDFLKDEPEAIEPVAEEPLDDGQPRDDQGRFAPKGVEEEGAPPAPVQTELPKEEYTALRAVRDENKALKDRLAEFEARPTEPPPPPPSVFEDEQGFGSHLVSTAVQQATLNAKLDMSEMMVRQANPDFEDMKATFLDLAKDNPGMVQTALADPHPWAKAYQIAKTHKAMQEVSATSVDELRAKLREEIVAEMAAQTPSRPALPPTLSTEQNVGSRSGPAWGGPQSIADLLR